MTIDVDYLIVGGGMSGVSMARLLQMAGEKSFVVLEADDEPGGLCRTKRIGDHHLDIGGGHFLCTKYREVYDFVFSHLPKSAFNFFPRISTIRLPSATVDYPVESNIWQLPLEMQIEYLVSVVKNGEARNMPPPSNYEEWIHWRLGDRIAEDYMLPYNRKLWGVDPQDMDIDWLHKIPQIDVTEILRSCLTTTSDAAKMPSHQGFYYPKSGGFQTIFDAILSPVGDQVVCGVPVDHIEQHGERLVVNGSYSARKIINTAPWAALARSPIISAEVREAIAALRHNSITVSLFEEHDRSPAHWTYLPDINLPHHRVFNIGNFAPHSNPLGVYRETNSMRFKEGAEIFSWRNDYAYPIPVIGWAERNAFILRSLRAVNIFGLGRWGQWEYFNSDVCIWQAMQLAEQLTGQPYIPNTAGFVPRCR